MSSMPIPVTEPTYRDRRELDHDVDVLLQSLLLELAARGVDRPAALASIRRVLRDAR